MINGATIAREERDEITYWHVELDSHDILVANGLWAESYLAMGNRVAFEEARGQLPALLEGRERTHADFCRPVETHGPALDFVRRRLLEQARVLGWTPSREADLRLCVDGAICKPLSSGDAAVFLFPAEARDVRLTSNAFVPRDRVGGSDTRALGISLVGSAFSGARGEPRRVSVDDPRLREGVHGVETAGDDRWRWTNGETALDPEMWKGLSGSVSLLVTYRSGVIRGWVAPQSSVEAKPRLYAVA